MKYSNLDLKLILLSSERKKQIVTLLFSKNFMYQSQIAEALNLTSATTKQHLDELIDVGLLQKKKSGKFLFYYLSEKCLEILKNMK